MISLNFGLQLTTLLVALLFTFHNWWTCSLLVPFHLPDFPSKIYETILSHIFCVAHRMKTTKKLRFCIFFASDRNFLESFFLWENGWLESWVVSVMRLGFTRPWLLYPHGPCRVFSSRPERRPVKRCGEYWAWREANDSPFTTTIRWNCWKWKRSWKWWANLRDRSASLSMMSSRMCWYLPACAGERTHECSFK